MHTLVKEWVIKITVLVNNVAQKCLKLDSNNPSIATEGWVASRFAYKSIRLHRSRFAYTTEVVSPTLNTYH